MVDMQSAAAEIRRRKKKEEEGKKPHGKNRATVMTTIAEDKATKFGIALFHSVSD